ncbi:cytochrome P450 [Actinoplanes sp. NPDC051633]|uniref:cytochrome P450 n=1 Tax=Actinoplanes sp. NPDC051633 TaxID=3155670 RepID=UPI00341AFFE0
MVQNSETSQLLGELTNLVGREDPYPRYDRLREIAPLIRADDGALVVTGYADCATVVRDGRLAHMSPDMLAFIGFEDWREHPALKLLFTSILNLNPPDHTRLRRLVSSAFTARRVQALRRAIERMVDELLAGMSGEADFIQAFAFPLPANVIGELLGVPPADRAQFQSLIRDWSQVLEYIDREQLVTADAAAATVYDYLAGLADQRRRKPADDLISAMVEAESAGDRLTGEELLTMAGLLFAAGFETTTNLLANSVMVLDRHPEAVIGDPALAVEELLRFDSPVQLVGRLAHEDVELGGTVVEAGERVIAYTGAGNRDPRRFTDPGRLDLSRADNAPLSFGGGIHYCLGAPLARLEAQIAIPVLRDRVRVCGEPTRRDSLTLRGYTAMPVRTT